ncbi:HAMP domain-containing sensor histidine kinase [Actinomycetota bacterium Odt1-20B]
MRVVPVSLRTTFTLAFAMIAAAVTLLVGFLSYDAAARLVRVEQKSVFNEVVHDLQRQVRGQVLDPGDYSSADPDHDGPRDDLIRPTHTVVQVLGPGGRIADHGSPPMPVTAEDRARADAEDAGRVIRRKVGQGGQDYRLATVSLGGRRGAVQVAQQFSDTEDLLKELQQRTVLLVAGVIVSSGLAGWWLARRITGRLIRLTTVAEQIARTGRLGPLVPVCGHDEVGRLGRAFDRMLARLTRSQEDQQRLVQDAGHELRTPLTSLRTNIALLRRISELPPAAREELIADMAEESKELSDLVNELVELAAGQADDEPLTEIGLADLAEDTAARTRRRTGRTVVVRPRDPATIEGQTAALHRAVANLLENAAKFDGSGAPIELEVTGARITVLDRGPGLGEADRSRVFDRFYRAPDARSLPGSGLGLSIVREVATAHGGTVFAEPRPGGGAAIGFDLTAATQDGEATGNDPAPSGTSGGRRKPR